MYQSPFNNYPYPTQPQMMQPKQPDNTLIRVTGLEGAKAYQMPPNSTVALFDGGEDLMFIKSTDGAGFPTIRTFRFEPIDNIQPVTGQVSREEFDLLRKELEDVKQSIQQPKSESKSK